MASSLGSSGGGNSSGGPGSNHGQGQALTDVTQIFDLLESNKPDVVQEVKDLILENLNSSNKSQTYFIVNSIVACMINCRLQLTINGVMSCVVVCYFIAKESWLVSGLYEYYIQSGSGRCSDILCGISREPHDKFLIERLTIIIFIVVKLTGIN